MATLAAPATYARLINGLPEDDPLLAQAWGLVGLVHQVSEDWPAAGSHFWQRSRPQIGPVPGPADRPAAVEPRRGVLGVGATSGGSGRLRARPGNDAA